MISEQTVIAAFVDKLAEYGIRLADPSRLKLDGNWHRARVDGDRGRAENLSYRIYFDERPAGYFEDHKRGVSGTFSVANGQDLSPAEREAAQAAWRARQREREAEQARGYREAAKRAQAAIQAAAGDPAEHPYIRRKGISPRDVYADGDGLLIVPVFSDFGVIESYQSIAADGEKLFMPGGRMAGSFHPIRGADKSRVLVCEGYATGAALSRESGHPVACAMSAGNLAAVVRKMQAKFPDREVVACPDNDWATEARIGRNPGAESSAALGIRVVSPHFPAGADPKHSDWDDWLRHYGTGDALRELIAGPQTATPPEGGADVAIDRGESDAGVTTLGEKVVEDKRATSDAASATPIATILTATLLQPVKIDAALDAAADPDADGGLPEMYSEDNVSLRFSQLFSEDLRYVAPWGRWMRWKDQRWIHEETLEVFDLSRKVCRSVASYVRLDQELTPKQRQTVASRYGQANTVTAIERLARADRRHAATIAQWDADPWLLNTPAGVVDLRTGAVTPGSRMAYMTKITRVAPGGACPTWHRFLEVATNRDADLIAFLQRMAGYALTGSTRDHALFFVYGTGGNGKGTFLNTLQWIMGDYAKSAPADMFTERKHEAHSTELARLMGARLVASQETEEGKRWAEAKIKALTGGDPVTARFMRQDDFEYIPQFKLVMTGNHKPGLRNVDEAIKRRLHLIPFTVTISPEDRDPDLGEKLRNEAAGILQWAIEGCLMWQKTGLRAPAAVQAATAEYMEQEDQFANWIAECCEVGTLYSNTAKPLYSSYKQWAEGAGEFAINQKRWAQQMQTRGFESYRASAGVMYRGIRVKFDNAY